MRTTIIRRYLLLLLAFYPLLAEIATPPPARAAADNLGELQGALQGTTAETKFLSLATSARGLAVILIVLWIIVSALAIVIMGKTQMAMNVVLGSVFLFGMIYIISMVYQGLQ